MIYDNKGYVLEYWMTNNIVDCGKIQKTDDLDIKADLNLTDRELEIMNRMDLTPEMMVQLYAEEQLKQIENENKPKHSNKYNHKFRKNKNKNIKKI